MDNKLNKCLISEELLLIDKRLKSINNYKIIIHDNLSQDFVQIKAINEEIDRKPKDIKFIR
jgi:hypothetical protein